MTLFTKFIILSIAVVQMGCGDQVIDRLSREEEPPIISLSEDDWEMTQAITNARKTINIFDSALKDSNTSYNRFFLKAKFESDTSVEHIWVGKIWSHNGTYMGVVNNVPQSIPGVEIGDTIEIKADQITDWMFIDDNKLRGGYTIRLLRSKMSDAEKKLFDSQYEFILED